MEKGAWQGENYLEKHKTSNSKLKKKLKNGTGGIRTHEPEGPEDSCLRKEFNLESGAFDRTSLPGRDA